jgi:5-methylthioadenosine/S-adenosylhomocysteine deaminase
MISWVEQQVPNSRLYRARHIVPVSSAAIIDGALVVEDSRIRAVGSAAEMAGLFPNAQAVDLGDSALLPAAVNAHTHLELTGLADAIPAGLSFSEWIVALVRLRRSLSHDDYVRAAQQGIAEMLAAGTAAVGEITTFGASVRPLAESGLRAVVYYELLGVDPADAPELLRRGQRLVSLWRSEYAGTQLRFGLSLHTPYTVSAELFRLAARWCAQEGIPLCIHAAESPAETAWLHEGSGEIADVLYAAAGWPVDARRAPGCSPIAYLDQVGALHARPLLVHGVHVDHDDLRLITDSAAWVAHCPRSNARLGCGRLPYAAYRRAGVRLALGTDSRASAPSLSLWEEMAAAYATHRAAGEAPDPHDLLRLATLGGAEALGFADELGSLDAGKHAHLARASLAPLDERERADSRQVLLALAQGRLTPEPVAA